MKRRPVFAAGRVLNFELIRIKSGLDDESGFGLARPHDFGRRRRYAESRPNLAAHLIARPEHAVQTLAGEELGLSEQSFANPMTAAVSATVSTAFGAFIPIIPFFFARGMAAIVASFAISTLAHFLIGAAKTIVTGLSPWRSGGEMTVVGLGEALITYGLGLLFGPMVG